MKKLTIILALLSGSVVAQPNAHYRELTTSGATIDWTTAKVSAEGYGAAPPGKNTKVGPLLACRAAVVDAQRNLLEATQGVRVTATTVVDNFILKSDEVKSTVDGLIKDARLIERKPDNTGGCKVVMEVSVAGKASSAIYQQIYGEETSWNWVNTSLQWLGEQVVPKAHAQEDIETLPAPWVESFESLSKRLAVLESKLSDAQLSQAVTPSKNLGPTGIVVDARGSNFIPSLSPKIRKLRGGVVYPDSSAATSARLLERGQLVSLFARDVDFAIQHPAVGSRPLLVKALRTYGDTRTEIVLSEEFADRIAELGDSDFFDEAGVIIVLD